MIDISRFSLVMAVMNAPRICKLRKNCLTGIDSPISATMSGLVLMVMKSGGEGGDGVHYDRPVSLPVSLDEYKIEQKISPGRPGIPAILPPWSQTDEKTYMDNLISDINREFIAGIDPNPNLSRSAKRPAMYPALRSGAVEVALIIGGSNARDLAMPCHPWGLKPTSWRLGAGSCPRRMLTKSCRICVNFSPDFPKTPP